MELSHAMIGQLSQPACFTPDNKLAKTFHIKSVKMLWDLPNIQGNMQHF